MDGTTEHRESISFQPESIVDVDLGLTLPPGSQSPTDSLFDDGEGFDALECGINPDFDPFKGVDQVACQPEGLRKRTSDEAFVNDSQSAAPAAKKLYLGKQGSPSIVEELLGGNCRSQASISSHSLSSASTISSASAGIQNRFNLGQEDVAHHMAVEATSYGRPAVKHVSPYGLVGYHPSAPNLHGRMPDESNDTLRNRLSNSRRRVDVLTVERNRYRDALLKYTSVDPKTGKLGIHLMESEIATLRRVCSTQRHRAKQNKADVTEWRDKYVNVARAHNSLIRDYQQLSLRQPLPEGEDISSQSDWELRYSQLGRVYNELLAAYVKSQSINSSLPPHPPFSLPTPPSSRPSPVLSSVAPPVPIEVASPPTFDLTLDTQPSSPASPTPASTMHVTKQAALSLSGMTDEQKLQALAKMFGLAPVLARVSQGGNAFSGGQQFETQSSNAQAFATQQDNEAPTAPHAMQGVNTSPSRRQQFRMQPSNAQPFAPQQVNQTPTPSHPMQRANTAPGGFPFGVHSQPSQQVPGLRFINPQLLQGAPAPTPALQNATTSFVGQSFPTQMNSRPINPASARRASRRASMPPRIMQSANYFPGQHIQAQSLSPQQFAAQPAGPTTTSSHASQDIGASFRHLNVPELPYDPDLFLHFGDVGDDQDIVVNSTQAANSTNPANHTVDYLNSTNSEPTDLLFNGTSSASAGQAETTSPFISPEVIDLTSDPEDVIVCTPPSSATGSQDSTSTKESPLTTFHREFRKKKLTWLSENTPNDYDATTDIFSALNPEFDQNILRVGMGDCYGLVQTQKQVRRSLGGAFATAVPEYHPGDEEQLPEVPVAQVSENGAADNADANYNPTDAELADLLDTEMLTNGIVISAEETDPGYNPSERDIAMMDAELSRE